MSRKQKKVLWRIIAAAVLLVAAALAPLSGVWRLIAFLVPYAVIGYDVLRRAIRNIFHGQVFDENFLMAIATVGALCVGEYGEACFVMLFYQVGELFQSVAVGKSRKSIASLMAIRPDVAHLVSESGELADVDPEEIPVGAQILVRPGERIPVDGTVLEGESWLDTAALTGESVPRHAKAGEAVISGCINQSGVLRIRADRAYGESTVARILEMVENSAERKSRSEAFITRFARIYTPAVVGCAVLISVIPPILLGDFAMWFHRALTFLVVSCPCALVISVPLSFFGGIGGAARFGVLFKGSNYLEALAQCDTVVFDKTGTLTSGTFRVSKIQPVATVADELLEAAALAEQYSSHPIAHSLIEAYGNDPDSARVGDVEEIAGQGVLATVDGRRAAVGNAALMARLALDVPAVAEAGSVVFVAIDGTYAGYIVISDEIKPDAAEAVSALRACGVRRLIMLTGDRQSAADTVGKALGFDGIAAECLPQDKVARVEEMLTECHGTRADARLAFVGDGVNDAPVLMRADVGVAMGALGSDAAIEAADVVLMDDAPVKLARAIRLARKTRRIVRQNIVFALTVKLLAMVLGTLGLTSLWFAVFADVGVAVIAILNAMRTLRNE